MKRKRAKVFLLAFAFALAFLAGNRLAMWTMEENLKGTVEEAEIEKQGADTIDRTDAVETADTGNWGLGFGESGTKPSGSMSAEDLARYNAYFMNPGEDKKLYLTFDCGYENGNTSAILDALQKHKAPATFFLVGHFLETSPELVKRMVTEGHTVGNHTYHHPDVSSLADQTKFREELSSVEELYKQITGEDMVKYYRPPQGKYSLDNLQQASDWGYKTFFWSLAYVDWNVDDQPSHEQAFDKLLTRVHPGAIVLLHNTSKTNGEILDELLTRWEALGYRFMPLSDLWEKPNRI